MAALSTAIHSVTVSQAYKTTTANHSSLTTLAVNCPIAVSFCDEQQTQLAYLLRLLKQASAENRWIMFLGQEALLDKELMIQAGIDIKKILVLKNKRGMTDHDLMVKALRTGNCSAVIANGDISDFQTQSICDATVKGHSTAFVVRNTSKNTHTFH
ncbi:cell division inhibitor SulA [Photobacterium damselae]